MLYNATPNRASLVHTSVSHLEELLQRGPQQLCHWQLPRRSGVIVSMNIHGPGGRSRVKLPLLHTVGHSQVWHRSATYTCMYIYVHGLVSGTVVQRIVV